MSRGRWISPRLEAGLRANLDAGEQSLLFLNRRGYAPAAICRACGNRVMRENCSAPLVVHRFGNRLQCHHCDFSMPMPRQCPKCGAEGAIIAYGPGVERLAEEVEALFPGARVAIMASDTVRSAREAQAFIERIEKHQLDIVIGTQLVTKGHHFPMLTLVGIVDADLGLSGGDLRAGERTYQQLWQVAGRAGRAERPGRVLVQTYMPEHPVMQALIGGDGPGFYRNEAAEREAAGWPPYGRLAALILSGPDEAAVVAQARALAARAPRGADFTVLGPAPAPYARLRGRFRHRFLVRARKSVDLQRLLRGWLAQVPEKSSVRVAVDIDPYSFL
jgi:primosomal protein N' (replication factor Y)